MKTQTNTISLLVAQFHPKNAWANPHFFYIEYSRSHIPFLSRKLQVDENKQYLIIFLLVLRISIVEPKFYVVYSYACIYQPNIEYFVIRIHHHCDISHFHFCFEKSKKLALTHTIFCVVARNP